ncbi:MAG: gliding motility-associated C-terminal domain-containing protein [Flavobacteriales bacterium]|nr:gliding motility-associated C-terminal domain-containing protein [Flavobacteriales bacterium]
MNIPSPIKGLSLFLAFSIGLIGPAAGQVDPLISNNGAMFFINGGLNDSAIVWVDGGVTNNDSLMVNLGKFIIHGDFINNATCGGDGSFPLQLPGNNGLFEIYGDWENNGIYRAGQGKVRFMTTDSIQGTSVTRFHDVDLIGDIRRIQDNVNSEIDATGTLKLNKAEWATDFDTLWVYNTSTGAIQRHTPCDTCGYVSSLQDGNLARATAQSVPYLFPTGSSLAISPNQFERYRPVQIKPETNAPDWYHVRFVNRVPTINSLPVDNVGSDICFVNPWWYHRINQTGGANANAEVALYSNPWEGDENYNGMANWSTANNIWENMGNTASAVTSAFWKQVVRYAWDDFQAYQDDAYIMSFNVPLEPVVTGDSALCASIESVYTVPENGSDYDFVVTGGTVTDQTDYSVTVVWDNDSLAAVFGNIQVIETVPNNLNPSNGGCVSLTENFSVEVWPLPVADFSISTDSTLPGGIFVHDILGMVDASINTSEWYWDFGDGTTSILTEPYHSYYETGTYTIQLVTRSGLECLDTLTIDVNVVEGLIVPNVFTPNNDGWNDVFDVRTSAVGPYKLEIYNRWGNVVFENSSPLISWDGTTSAGTPASAGTYFYVISKAEMLSGNAINNELDNFSYKETGWLQLIR